MVTALVSLAAAEDEAERELANDIETDKAKLEAKLAETEKIMGGGPQNHASKYTEKGLYYRYTTLYICQREEMKLKGV